jgi:hypothetical protein
MIMVESGVKGEREVRKFLEPVSQQIFAEYLLLANLAALLGVVGWGDCQIVSKRDFPVYSSWGRSGSDNKSQSR